MQRLSEDLLAYISLSGA